MTIATRVTLPVTTLIGRAVENMAGENLGTIKNIVLDVDSGRIAYAVLSFGGFLGLGDKLFAVPWNVLRLDSPNHAFLWDVDKETLQRAEGFDKDHWPDMADPAWATRIHEYYQTLPYWE